VTTDRSVLITGCSSGFGMVSAAELARRGWRVFATMRNLDKRLRLDDAVAAVNGSERVEVFAMDVNDQASVHDAVAKVQAATGGGLGAVVHNAGVSGGGAFEDLSDDEIRLVMETNFYGVLRVTKAVLPAMRARGAGRVLVVSSAAAFRGTPGQSHYVASKWAVEGWAESVSMEVRQFGIDVICVEPGPYRSDIWETAPRTIPDDSAYAAMSKPLERFVEERVIPRARDPQEVATVIADALESSHPRFRYPVGPEAHVAWAARGKVPHRVFERLTARVIGLPSA
jgi:NAD(P)-dependent dehydrogenase (short-subunit alcohol dehydrogenase family)